MIDGIVMEVHKRYVILMTDDGDFVKVKTNTSSLDVGMEISCEYYPLHENNRAKKWFSLPSLRTQFSFALAFILFFSGLSLQFEDKKAYAHISVDVNPSFEFEVNKSNEVINIVPLNEDGEKVVKQLNNWRFKPLENVSVDCFDILRKSGYLVGDRNVILSTSLVDEKGKLSADFERYIEETEQLNVIAFHIPKEVRNKALAEGVSPGKYAAWIHGRKQGVNIPLAQLKNESVSSILNAYNQKFIALDDASITITDLEAILTRGNSHLALRKVINNTSPIKTLTGELKELEDKAKSIALVTEDNIVSADNIEPTITKTSKPKSINSNTRDVMNRNTKPVSITVGSNKPINKPVEKPLETKPVPKPSNPPVSLNPGKGQGKPNTGGSTGKKPEDKEPIPNPPNPNPSGGSDSGLSDEYVAGDKYPPKDDSGENPPSSGEGNNGETGKGNGNGDGSHDEEDKDNGNNNGNGNSNENGNGGGEEDSPTPPPASDDSGDSCSNPSSAEQEKECSCKQNGYYVVKEMVLFFEVDENGNFVEVWKEIEVKKAC